MGINRARNQIFCHFLKFDSIVFLEIAHKIACNNVSNLVEVKFTKQNLWDPKLSQRGQNRAGNQVFCHFLKFGLLFFLEIPHSRSLQQCLTSSRDKTLHKKFWGPFWTKNGQNQTQNQFFLPFCQVWFITFPLNCIG